MENILIVAEQSNGEMRSPTLHAITFGKRMLDFAEGGELLLLVLGANIDRVVGDAARYDVDKVIVVDSPNLKNYQAETYAPVVAQVAKSYNACIVGAVASAYGKDLMPRVAAILDAGMASDISAVIGLRSFERPMIAGSVIAEVEVLSSTVVTTVRQSEFSAAQPNGSALVEPLQFEIIPDINSEVLNIEKTSDQRIELNEAKVVVAGGRGMNSLDNFNHLAELTDVLGGAIGATRAACDAGMAPYSCQIGQTGRVVAPELYIAVGISGAIQHVAGMKSSKIIVAINRDEEAPIFQVADYGLVSRWEEVLPELISGVKHLKKNEN